jgi:hypothetical protein
MYPTLSTHTSTLHSYIWHITIPHTHFGLLSHALGHLSMPFPVFPWPSLFTLYHLPSYPMFTPLCLDCLAPALVYIMCNYTLTTREFSSFLSSHFQSPRAQCSSNPHSWQCCRCHMALANKTQHVANTGGYGCKVLHPWRPAQIWSTSFTHHGLAMT